MPVIVCMEFTTEPKFKLRRLVATPAALGCVSSEEIAAALERHVRGDWGEVDQHDRAANDQALLDGSRILSAYKTDGEVSFWIITEADRSATTILLPEDY